MMSELQVTAMRDDAARRLFEIESAPAAMDEGDVPEERAARAARLRMVVDVLTTILVG
jgi:hypothetical protein